MSPIEKIEKIVNIIADAYPIVKMFKVKILKGVRNIPKKTLERIIGEIKEVLE